MSEDNQQPIDSKEMGMPESLDFEGYDPIACNHKLASGFSSWIFLSGEQGAGPDMDVDIHLCCCGKCGEIKIGGRRLEKGVLNRFNEEFGLHYPDAVAAIAKCCNWFCRDAEGYDPFVRLSDSAARIAQLEERLKDAEVIKESHGRIIRKLMFEIDMLKEKHAGIVYKAVRRRNAQDAGFDDYCEAHDLPYKNECPECANLKPTQQ